MFPGRSTGPWLVLALLVTPSLGLSQPTSGAWTLDGVPVETLPASQASLALPVPDMSGGLYVVWQAAIAGGTTGEVRCTHLLGDGTLDSRWPAGGRVVGGFPNMLQALPDGAGGVYVLFGSDANRRITRLDAAGSLAPGWTTTGVRIGSQALHELHVTGDGSIWGVYGRLFVNCPIGHDYCETLIEVGARRLSPAGVDITSPSQGFWGFKGGDVLTHLRVAGYPEGIVVYYEFGIIGLGYQRSLGRKLASGPYLDLMNVSSPVRDYSLYVGADPSGSVYTTEGGYAVSRTRRYGALPDWPDAWTYSPGAYSGAYPLGVLPHGDGSVLSHNAVFQANPDPSLAGSFLQRILPNGAADPAWPMLGLSTSGPDFFYQSERTLIPDGRGGCLVTWEDRRTGEPDVYVLPIESAGRVTPGWLLSGTAICRQPDSRQTRPRAAHDGLGNLFVVWVDERHGARDVYAQKITADRPVATSVQSARGWCVGGVVELAWELSSDEGDAPTVERSQDGMEWRPLGLARAGVARGAWRYTDSEPIHDAVNHYRLHRPTALWTGGEVAVRVDLARPLRVERIAPNPVDSELEVSFVADRAAPIEFAILDLQGREFSRQASHSLSGANAHRWSLPGSLPAGVYWLEARQDAGRSRARFVVVR